MNLVKSTLSRIELSTEIKIPVGTDTVTYRKPGATGESANIYFNCYAQGGYYAMDNKKIFAKFKTKEDVIKYIEKTGLKYHATHR